MKKFKFRLNTVLKVKQKKEDSLKTELVGLKKILELETSRLNKLKNDKLACQKELKQLRSKDIDINKLALYEYYLEALKQKIANQTSRVEGCKVAVGEKKAELLEASKEKKAVEKLHDKRYSEYLSDVQSAEQKIFDEISTVRYGRKVNEVG